MIAAILAQPLAAMAQVKVITSGGFASALQQMLPQFEKASGIQVSVTRGASQGDGPATIAAQLRTGVPADVVIMSREGLDDLIKEGKIVAGSDVNLAQTPLGMSVRAGAPKPKLTVDAFKETLLHAQTVNIPSSTTGIYMKSQLFPRLGIDQAVAGKVVDNGVADVALRPVSELMAMAGMDLVGPVPADIQFMSVFSAAIVKGSKEAEAAQRLLAYLASAQAQAVLSKSGMEPPKAP